MLLVPASAAAVAIALALTLPTPLSSASLVGSADDTAAAAIDIRSTVAARSWKTIVLHHSATPEGSVESIDAAHRRRRDPAGKPWLGIGYHFVVGNGAPMADGEIRPTFRWQQQLAGAHAGRRDQNEHGIGICLVGNFDEQEPTERQRAALSSLIRLLSRQYAITRDRVVRHQDFQATRCPGRLLAVDEILSVAFATSEGT